MQEEERERERGIGSNGRGGCGEGGGREREQERACAVRLEVEYGSRDCVWVWGDTRDCGVRALHPAFHTTLTGSKPCGKANKGEHA
eukprot:2520064-Rhodomonas_salina.6